MSAPQRLVSLWVGKADSEQALEDYLTFTYTLDGDAIPCTFGKDFQIDWFDEDYREAGTTAFDSQSLRVLLAKHSDADEIAGAFSPLVGESLPFVGNAAVLLYDFEYDGRVQSVDSGPVQLRFVGTVSY